MKEPTPLQLHQRMAHNATTTTTNIQNNNKIEIKQTTEPNWTITCNNVDEKNAHAAETEEPPKRNAFEMFGLKQMQFLNLQTLRELKPEGIFFY